jgi:hypothetical protein
MVLLHFYSYLAGNGRKWEENLFSEHSVRVGQHPVLVGQHVVRVEQHSVRVRQHSAEISASELKQS